MFFDLKLNLFKSDAYIFMQQSLYLDKKLLIKGKVSKICDFFDAEYDVNTVLRLDPHYRT
ncbi:hypothetical protein KAM398_27230 [Acinetobacter sp. KAM398]|nr:hypothetical protein KAM392_27060 [Acinetobacter sp. KAM392]GJC35540.1 hypothetical protein KAM393_27090 [Acinetobacter sp. KAM393]GJC38366.1 hypothetical protein KAM394_27060 [Acinetobacter sp. KAM394]GJC41193.1 hypothetical protein KAM395_27140 [Acinetobacter sp. KAM395]GJC43997.1 hypothetical protein KAM396_26940 [Acinetobacter sp. KAM396]GJC46835.1 hypothetical protein KAM397_27150 [Acinetobacter sp. KAM397]GJC49671.1 hypothetical protein KAM398_27230 [Acinetobacter sp. KAM398]GJC5531